MFRRASLWIFLSKVQIAFEAAIGRHSSCSASKNKDTVEIAAEARVRLGSSPPNVLSGGPIEFRLDSR